MRHTSVTRALAFGFVLSIAPPGCRQFGFTRVGDGVYIAGSNPAIERAGEEISTARKQARGNDPANSALPDLSVAINPSAGLGPEDFRILVEDKAIRVEGGGPAGAYYGGLEVARRIREGRSTPSIVLPRSTPGFPFRAVRAGIDLPGLSSKPAAGDWRTFIDRVAAGRFNALILSCDDCFPALVRLARFPKAFEGLDRDGAARQKVFRELLAYAEERNVRLLLVPAVLRAPQPFLRSYGTPGADEASRESLSQSFLRECITELLRSYPQLLGVGVSNDSLVGRPAAKVDDFVRNVHVEGIRASGRSATLFVASDVSSLLAKLGSSGVEVLREVNLTPSLAAVDARGAPVGNATAKLCGRLPLQSLFPSWPTPERCAAILDAARTVTPNGFTIDLFSSSASVAQGSYLLEREGLLAACFGLSASQPPLEPASWAAMWGDSARAQSDALLQAARACAEIWPELARFHGGPSWSPLTLNEAGGAADGKDLRDDQPFLSIVELVFSPSGHPGYLNIPDSIALEAKKQVPAQSLRAPLDAAGDMLAQSTAALNALATRAAETGGGLPPASIGFASAAATEIEAVARLGEFHARRIRAGVFLLRHAAGISDGARAEAIAEMDRAAASWSLAEEAFTRLRSACPGGSFPDLKSGGAGIKEDLRLVRAVKSDPIGFQASPLWLEARSPSAPFDFRALRGFVDLGASVLNSPPVELLDDSQLFEAEDFSGTWSLAKDISGYSGKGYASSGAAGERSSIPLTLRLRVKEPALVHVWVKSLVGGGGESPSVRIRAGAVELKPTHASASGSPRFAWERAGKLQLDAGETFVQIRDEGTGREGVDAVVLSRDGNWTPPTF
jgi:hypothetical protein